MTSMLSLFKPPAPSPQDQPHLSINREDSSIDESWIHYVEHHPDGIFFHHPRWFRTLEKENQQRVIRLVAKNSQGNLVGILPLIFTRGMPLGIGGALACRRLTSLPRTPYCGPLSDNQSVSNALLQKAININRAHTNTLLQIKSMNPHLGSTIPKLIPVRWRKTYVKYFPDPPHPLKFGNSRNNQRIKSTINRAQRINLTAIEATSKRELEIWYQLYVRTMQRHMIPSRSYAFFSTLWDQAYHSGYLKILLAQYQTPSQSLIVAGSIFLLFNKTVYYAFNGSNTSYSSLRSNDLILWTMLQKAHNLGYRIFDFGEVADTNEGLRKFKTKWYCEEKAIYHYYFPEPQAKKKKNKIVRKKSIPPQLILWQKLPPAITSFIGKYTNYFL